MLKAIPHSLLYHGYTGFLKKCWGVYEKGDIMNVKISKFYKGAGSLYSFVFDDGCYRDSTLEVAEAFKETERQTGVKLKATSAQTVNFINAELKAMWDKLLTEGVYDISAHSITHCLCYNLDTPEEKRRYEAEESKKLLEKMYPSQKIISFVIPNGDDTKEGREILKDYYFAVRSGHDYINDVDNLDWYNIGTFTAKLAYSVADYAANIDKTIEKGGWSVQLNHWLSHKEKDAFHAQRADTFLPECMYLAKKCLSGDICVMSFNEAVMYYRERECAKIEILTETDRGVSLKINCPLDKKTFTQRLTLEIKSPEKVTATQKADTLSGILAKELPVYEKNGIFFADVLPNTEISIRY